MSVNKSILGVVLPVSVGLKDVGVKTNLSEWPTWGTRIVRLYKILQ